MTSSRTVAIGKAADGWAPAKMVSVATEESKWPQNIVRLRRDGFRLISLPPLDYFDNETLWNQKVVHVSAYLILSISYQLIRSRNIPFVCVFL